MSKWSAWSRYNLSAIICTLTNDSFEHFSVCCSRVNVTTVDGLTFGLAEWSCTLCWSEPYPLTTTTSDSSWRRSREELSTYRISSRQIVRTCYVEWSKSTRKNAWRYEQIISLTFLVRSKRNWALFVPKLGPFRSWKIVFKSTKRHYFFND